MGKKLCKYNLVIDFDSTFIKFEALDELAKIALANDPEKNKKTAEVEKITNEGMLGEISFPESLQARLKLFNIERKHIEELIVKIEKNITESFLKHKDFFLKNNKNIYIVSGGFLDYISPVVKKFGISEEHILANEFIFKGESVVGINKENFLAKEDGKVSAIKHLGIKNVVVIGDGWTDYEIKKAGLAENFIAYTENIFRDKVVKEADLIANDFGEIINFAEKI